MKNETFIFVPEDYHLKKYERRGMMISLLFHALVLGTVFIDIKSFSRNKDIPQKSVIQVELVERDRIIVPEISKSELMVEGISNQKGEIENKENAAISNNEVVIEAKDFYEGNTTLPFEKIDFEAIRKKVLAHLIYPAVAKQNKWEETIQLALTINTSGELVGIRIGKPAKQQIFNDIVLLAMEKIKNDIFPKPTKTSTVLFDIEFSL